MAGSITDILQAADQRIDAARENIMNVAGVFGGSFGDDIDDFVPGTIDAQVGRLDDRATSLSARMSGPLATALTGGTTLFTERHGTTDRALADWQRLVADCDGEYQSFGTAIDTIRANIGTTLSDLKNVIDAMSQSIDGSLDGLDQSVTSWNRRLELDAPHAVELPWHHLGKALEYDHIPAVANLLTTSESVFDRTLTELFGVAANSLQQLASDVDGAFDNLDTHLTDHARQKVQEAVVKLVQEGIEEVLKTITSAILKSNFGVTVTTSIAPVYPEIKFLNESGELILAGIRSYKKAVGLSL